MTSSRRLSPPRANSRSSWALAPRASKSVPSRSGGVAEVPDAVADVALLVVVDAAVGVDEARQQSLLLEVAGDEAERGQAEGALDH